MQKSTRVKMCLSAGLVILALIAACTRRTPYVLLAFPGMLLGFHGDMCLAEVPFVKKAYKVPFMVGAASFLIGHLFYIAAFISAMNTLSYGALWLALLVYTLVTLLAWGLAMRGGNAPTALRVGLLLYALVIGVMASFGVALGSARGGILWLAALGGLLFVVSDGLIALKDFMKVDLPHADTLIWAIYVPAQLCIVLLGFFA